MKGTLTRGEPVKRTTAVTLQIKSFVKLSLATKNMFSISCREIANSSLFPVELSRPDNILYDFVNSCFFTHVEVRIRHILLLIV